MLKLKNSLLAACLVFTSLASAQSVIVSRTPDFPVTDRNGILAGESNRFGNFSGFYPADHFVLDQTTTLDNFVAYGSTFISSSFPLSALEGVTLQIFEDNNGIPDGNAFADVASGGNYGSDGIVYLPAIELGSGLTVPVNGGGATNIGINFTQANGGDPITLPAGEYWITLAPRTPDWHPGDPSGRWKWQSSLASSEHQRVSMSRTTFGDVEVWEPVSTIGNSFAWELTGEASTMIDGDFNDDGIWNCLDIDALVSEVVANTNNVEFDINGDGAVTAADVTGAGGWLEVGGANNAQTNGSPFIAGDANLDGAVDVSDFNLWNANKFTPTTAWCAGDFNVDGSVDVSDFNLWNANKFQASDAPGVNAVPEPTGLWLLLIGILPFARQIRIGSLVHTY